MPRGAGAMRWLFNLWPPFLFAGIRVLTITPDFGYVRVRLRRRWFNRNYVGTHFGGSLFAMTDPFWMIMILHALGRDYLVWDRAARIEFVQATRADVYAEFRLDPAVVDDVRRRAADGSKVLFWLPVEVRTADGAVVARIEKQLYVRLKKRVRPKSGAPLAEVA